LAERDELGEFCLRVLGPGEQAEDAADEARRAAQGAERLELLAAAAAACRSRAGDEPPPQAAPAGDLASAVRAEVEQATAKLPERQREALALREALGLGHDEIAAVMRIDPAAVAPLLSRARLRLREERRGAPAGLGECPDRERALRLLAMRQDAEPADADDADWILTHIGECEDCGAAHAAMLEASVCYRGAAGR
jgi:DNA-directed RNA polymerase specialized sigma24 family protein